ncbi:MAG TPA: sulfotransferase family 2 domain-containing protein [Aestuariivirga sp.]|nr:sulfotransferase family 2 domain-containing protein [Aestuariivirga sp.]
MISHKYKCIFVHIPKTGGTSIENCIWPAPRNREDLWMGFVSSYRNKYQTGGLQHLLARHIRLEVGGNIFNAYFKFAIVRNPWDKLVSQYTYLRKRKDLQHYLGVTAETTFAQYIEAAALSDHVQLTPQVDFVNDENGLSIVDFIGRFETLKEDAQRIFSRIGIQNMILPHTQRSLREKDYRSYYTAETRDRVAQIYERDIALFKYKF